MRHGQPGFTIVEILIVLVIMGIMAAIAFGGTARMEVDRRRNAVENLKVIYNMEKRYQLDKGQFFPLKDPLSGTCLVGTVAEINTGLGIFIRDSDFSYAVQGACLGTTTTGYNAVASRLNGPCAGKTVTLTQAGGESIIEACALW